MGRPTLVVVTGEPGSGKSTLGRALAAELHLPYLSRDDVRWGLRATAGLWTNNMTEDVDRRNAVESFLHLIETAAQLGVTAVLEYMVFTSNPETLDRLHAVANCLVVLTESRNSDGRASHRDRQDLLLRRPEVLAALGHESIGDYLSGSGRETARSPMIRDFDLPTLRVRTDDGYEPPMRAIVDWVVALSEGAGEEPPRAVP